MKIFTGTKTILDTVAQAFDFTVQKFPLAGPDNMKTPFYGLFRDDNSECIGNAVSGDYVPHTTDDVLAIVEATQEVFSDCDARTYFKEGHYVDLAPTTEMRRTIYGTADNIFPRLTIFAGYDGRAFKVHMGYFRDLCLNLHRMKSIKSTYVSIRHTSGLRGKMNELIDQFAGLKNGWEDLGQVIDRMESTPVELAAFLDKVYGTPTAEGRSTTIHTNRTEAIFKRVLDERRRSGRPQIDGSFTVSAWEAFNAVQGYVQHDASRKGKPNQFDRILASSNDPAVNIAESLAYSLAV
jgi:hypothetical protein